MTTNTKKKCAVVFGVDEAGGLAAAIALRAAREGLQVYVAGHQQSPLDDVAANIERAGGSATAVTLDASDSTQVNALFRRIGKEGCQPVLVTHGGRRLAAQAALETSVADVEAQWRSICFAGCLIGQEAIRRMLPAQQGTLLFLGHTTALPAEAGAAAFSAASAGLRSFTQSMAREFGPKGIHVAHVVLDDAADNASRLSPDAVAETCWQLHRQHKTSWTLELDLRSFK